jgi:cell wall-associated NlpC family hydrolase
VQTWRFAGTARSGRFIRRGAALSIGLLAAGALVVSVGVAAGAAAQPTVSQVQQKLSKLNKQADVLDEQYDQAQQALSSASQQLTLVNEQAARYLARFNSMRKQIAQIAAEAYEQGSLNSPEVLLTSNDPQEILDQSSMLLELSSSNTSEMKAFISAAKQLAGAQEAARRTKDARAALASKLSGQKKTLEKTIAQQQALLNQLTPAQQAAAGPGGGAGAGTGTIGQHDPLPTSSQAEKAVEFAYDQLGCEYVFGGTGPCSQGFDCSGLTQAAWAFAGVSIPRTSYEQADLPAVPESQLAPGDIMEFSGDGHVGIYVGGGMLIDAPHTGAVVEKVAFSGWFTANFDGAVRP